MSNFEARIQRQRAAMDAAKKKDAAAEEASKQEAEARDAKRLDGIKSDKRYIQMKEIAYSKELREALEVYKSFFARDDDSRNKPIEVVFSDNDSPVGCFYVKVPVRKFWSGNGDSPDSPAEFHWLTIRWRDKATKRKYVKGRSGNKVWPSTPSKYVGLDADPGLGMDFKSAHYDVGDDRQSPVFYELDTLLDYLAKLVVQKQEKPKSKRR